MASTERNAGKLLFESYFNKTNCLKRGDIIKFGRVKYRIKDLCIPYSPESSEKVSFIQISSPVEEQQHDVRCCDDLPEYIKFRLEKDCCKFCFMTTHTDDNPLLSICICKGSMKFIHLACLRQWIDLKTIEKESNFLETYFFKNFSCEICLTKYACILIKTLLFKMVKDII